MKCQLWRHFLFLQWLILELGAPSALAQDSFVQICPNVAIFFEGKPDFDFTDSEKIFICGSSTSEAWRSIPLYQIEFHLKAILQSHGYLSPQFHAQADRLEVKAGSPTQVKVVSIHESPIPISPHRYWRIFDKKLTPESLDEIETWVSGELRAQTYACAKVEALPEPEKSGIIANVISGGGFHFDKIEREEVPGVSPLVLSRFDAFQLGEPFNEQLLRLTEERIIRQSFAPSTHFEVICEENRPTIRQYVVPGKPRTLSIGIGVNTVDGPIARISWMHSRLGRRASTIHLVARASWIEQELEGTSYAYFFENYPRFYFRPLISGVHRNDSIVHEITTEFSTFAGLSLDNNHFQLRIESGPSGNYNFIFDELGRISESTRAIGYLSWKSTLELMTHNYELSLSDPFEGAFVGVSQETIQDEFLSPFSAYRFELKGKVLFNLGNYVPHRYIFGLRTGWSTTLTADRFQAQARSILPPALKYYLGLTELRGFGHKELPADGMGALTSGYASAEFRYSNQLPLTLDPYIFVDGGALGAEQVSFDRPLFSSLGIGLAAHPPFGVLSASLAHGFVHNVSDFNEDLEHWQFYFNFGRVF